MFDTLHKLRRLDELIRTKGTGAPKQLARRLGISERSLFEYISLMKELGAPIRYSRSTQSYWYEGDGRFFVGFVREEELIL